MKTLVLFNVFAFILLRNTEGYNVGPNLMSKLTNKVDRINQLIVQVQKAYCNDMYRHPLPRDYDNVLKGTSATLYKASRLVEEMSSKNCRKQHEFSKDDLELPSTIEQDSNELERSNKDRTFKKNFYKALSRALKNEYKDEPVVQETIHDGFSPPTWLEKLKQ